MTRHLLEVDDLSPAELAEVLERCAAEPERVLDVRWVSGLQTLYPSRILIQAWDRRELIKDIGTLLAAEKVNVTGMNAQHTEQDNEVGIELTVQVADFAQLATLLSRLQTIPGVTQAQRLK